MKKGQLACLIAVIVLCAGGIFGYVKYRLDNDKQAENVYVVSSKKKLEERLEKIKESVIDNYVNNGVVTNRNDLYFKEQNKDGIIYYSLYSQKEIYDGIYKVGSVDEIVVYSGENNNVYSYAIISNKDLAYGKQLEIEVNNIDLVTGNSLTSQELLNRFGITNSSFSETLKNFHLSYLGSNTIDNLRNWAKEYNDPDTMQDVENQISLIRSKSDEVKVKTYSPDNYNIFINNKEGLSVFLNNEENVCIIASYCEDSTISKVVEL